MKFQTLTRRAMIAATALAMTAGLGSVPASAQDDVVDVAAIYTVPVEQQWVGRIHKALNAAQERGEITYEFSENVANTDYERVMREYAEQGKDLIIGEVFGVERAARAVAADYPEIAFLMGSSFGPSQPNFAVFDNFIHEPSYLTGMIAGAETESEHHRHGRRLRHPRGQPPDARLHGRRALEVNPDVKFLVSFINSWYDPPRAKEAAFAMIDRGADIMYAERFGVSDAAKERGIKAIGNVIDTAADYPGRSSPAPSGTWSPPSTAPSRR
jgi:basic membrane protein A and related proteins